MTTNNTLDVFPPKNFKDILSSKYKIVSNKSNFSKLVQLATTSDLQKIMFGFPKALILAPFHYQQHLEILLKNVYKCYMLNSPMYDEIVHA